MGYTLNKAPIGTRVRTGDVRPESGIWRVEGCPTTVIDPVFAHWLYVHPMGILDW